MRVVIAEDLALLREGVVALLRENGIDALSAFEKAHPPIDVLLTDVVMPQMGGRELAARLIAIRMRGCNARGDAIDLAAGDGLLIEKCDTQSKRSSLDRRRCARGTGAEHRDVAGLD